MKPTRLYANALRRYNRSHGFGIHSPFAFSFVRDTLCCRYKYYAYEHLSWLRLVAQTAVSLLPQPTRIMSLKNAELLHRVAARFPAGEYLEIGGRTGLSTAALLLADSRSTLSLCRLNQSMQSVFTEVTREFVDRINPLPEGDISVQITEYMQRVADRPFILINSLTAADADIAGAAICQAVRDRECIVIVRNLTRKSSLTAGLWRNLTADLAYGMSFTNGNIGFVIALKHLPVQHFTLWY